MNMTADRLVISKAQFLVVIFVLGAILSLMFVRLAWTDGDEGRYLLLARAVADGVGQADIHLPSPTPEWLTPSGYVYYVAGWVRCFGNNVTLLRLSSVVPMFFFVLFFGCFVLNEMREGVLVQFSTVVLGALGVGLLTFSWVLLSETFFLFILYLALWAGSKGDKRGKWSVVLLGICAALSMLVRPVGLALIMAGFSYFLVHRKWKALMAFCVTVVIIYLPEVIRVWHYTGVPLAYLTHYQTEDGSSAVGGGLFVTIRDMLHGFGGYFFYYLPRSLFFSLFDNNCLLAKLRLGWLILPGTYLISGAIVWGFLCRIRKLAVSELFWIFYWPLMCSYNKGAEFLVAGTFHYQPRYLLPIIPLAAFYFFIGINSLLRTILRNRSLARWSQVGVASVCVVYVLGTSALVGLIRVRNEWRMRRLGPWDPERIEASGEAGDVAFARYIEVAEWMTDNLPKDAVVASRKPRHTYLFSDRKGFRYDMDWLVASQDVWGNMLAYQQYGPVYILQDAFPELSGYGWTRVCTLDPAIEAHTDELVLVYETKKPVSRLWKIKE